MTRRLWLGLFVGALNLVWLGAALAVDAVIEVDTGNLGIRMSQNLWGIFFEEINFAGDGGLYAELIRNRSFEAENNPLEAWSAIERNATGKIEIDRDTRLNEVRKQALRVRIESVEAGGEFGVVNSGYWGIPVREGETCTLSLFAKSDAALAGKSLQVSLRDAKGDHTYAESSLGKLGRDWQKLTCTLRPDKTDFDGRLVISSGDAGEFWLDVVSLFPQTWKNQPNGLRPDLAELLAQLKPSFLRFPGGCFAEGSTLANAFRFKETVGPIEQRKGRQNLWGYRSSDGLGYYEYLRLSEDLGADPIFCINPGANNGCTEVIPTQDMAPWLQTAVDAVEFALGAADTPWGARRAAMGHPQPFAFKTFFLQIGNETEFGFADYMQRLDAYRDRVKAAWPGDNVQIIVDSWGAKGRQDIEAFAIDMHQYSSWGQAIASRDKYDHTPRGEPYVFEGEYATRGSSGVRQALSEAVYMMGLEENADEVIMAAYAPLFGHVDGCQWKPDLIYFDNHRSMGTISYYVQQMFSLHRGDRQLPLSLQLAPKDPKPVEEIPADMIGVATWSTQAEYKDIVVVTPDGQRHAVDLSGASPLKDWQTQGGRWEVADGILRQTSRATDCRAWFKGAKWKDYTLRLKARKTAGKEGFLIMFRVRGSDDYAWANLGGWGNRDDAIEQAVSGQKLQAGRRPGSIEAGRWYDIELDVRGHRMTCRVDGQTRLQADLKEMQGAEPQDLYATACDDEKAGEILVRVVNFTGEPKRTRLSIKGAGSEINKATAITLAADDIEAFQSLDAPTRYSPAHAVLPDFAKNDEHVFAPYSFTILRLKPNAQELKAVE